MFEKKSFYGHVYIKSPIIHYNITHDPPKQIIIYLPASNG